MKRIFIAAWCIALAAVAGLSGCAIPQAKVQAEEGINEGDIRELFPVGDHHHRTAAVTKRQAKDINRLMGYTAIMEGETFSYVNVHPFPKHRGVIVHLFDGKAGPLTLLVAIKQDKVNGVAAKGKVADIPGLHDFLDQFVGRTLNDSFEIAGSPADLLTMPPKLQGLKDFPDLSLELAMAVKKALAAHKVMGM